MRCLNLEKTAATLMRIQFGCSVKPKVEDAKHKIANKLACNKVGKWGIVPGDC